jgi:peptidoglycan/xylan/chitin deacetylase (PgdA/CDA1 family)
MSMRIASNIRADSAFIALMYHNIVGPEGMPGDIPAAHSSYFVAASNFAAQMNTLSNCQVAPFDWESLPAFYGLKINGEKTAAPNSPAALVTFDDGWRGAVELGGPILESHRRSAIIFITTDWLDRPHFLRRSELHKLNPAHFRVGSHTRSHSMLCLLKDSEIIEELSSSRKQLEDLTGYRVDTISIPNGAVDERVRRIAAETGYRFVFDSEIGINRSGSDPLAIGRVAVKSDTPLSAFTRYSRLRIGRERLRRLVLQIPKTMLGLRRYDRVRRTLLAHPSPLVQR